jgi:hypothetical protein
MASFGKPTDVNNFITSNYNVNTNHPLIPNKQEYMFYDKYISIHSEDRDLLKYPNSSEFEIELPQDMLNVSAIKLVQWTFPSNYSTFSIFNNNILFAFKITKPYNPGEYGLSDELAYRIFEALFLNQELFIFTIEEGFYNPLQMATELTNKMNSVVTDRILKYFTEKGWNDSITQFNSSGGYTRFIVVYNNVSLKLWFGNNADGFTIVHETELAANEYADVLCFSEKKHLPNASNWGLMSYLGLPKCNTQSISNADFVDVAGISRYNGIVVPRFYYGDVTPGDEGYWLLPNTDLSGSVVHWIESPFKINLMGEAFIYMELAEQNCIDETKPYNVSPFTLQTNQTNGVVDAAFAKIGVPSTPLSQWFDRDSIPYKYYYPPAERIRRLKIRIRYHNGQLVNFGLFNYSFMLQFTLMVPQILRTSKNIVYPQHSNNY